MSVALLKKLAHDAWRRLQDDRGVVALMTICFMLFMGIFLIFFLWTIGWTLGAYNTLQGAAQSAAYASVGAVTLPEDGAGSQPQFDCGPSYNAVSGTCTSGYTAMTARTTLSYALANTEVNFGLVYNPYDPASGSVRLLEDPNDDGSYGEQEEINGITAYQIDIPAGQAAFLDPDCQGVVEVQGVDRRTCWTTPVGNLLGFQYVSGVIIEAQAEPRFPICRLGNICAPMRIQATVAAAQDQVSDQQY